MHLIEHTTTSSLQRAWRFRIATGYPVLCIFYAFAYIYYCIHVNPRMILFPILHEG